MRQLQKISDALQVRDNDIVLPMQNFTLLDDSSTTIVLDVQDWGQYFDRKFTAAKKYDTSSQKVVDADAYSTLAIYWNSFVSKAADGYTHIYEALKEEYEILDNYNGYENSTMTDDYDKDTTLTLATSNATQYGKTDTETKNLTDSTQYGKTDTETKNMTDSTQYGKTDTKTNGLKNTTENSGSDTTLNQVTGYNEPSDFNNESKQTITHGQKIESTNSGNDIDKLSGTDSTTMTGTDTMASSGTDSTTMTGTDTMASSGTDTTTNSGTETTAEDGTVTHTYELHKHGNLGITTSQMMLESEILLRTKYNIKDMIIKDFIARYTFY